MLIELLLARVLFVCGFALLGLVLARALKLDVSLTCIAAGIAAGFSLPYLMFDTGVRAHNLQDLVFYIILPVLIFEGAWYLDPKILRKWLLPTLVLAIPGVLIATLASGALIYFGIDHPRGFPWAAAFLTGSIIAATDPAAVISRLRTSGAPEDLSTLMESEALFNDATSVVLFSLLLALALGQEMGGGASMSLEFTRVFIGGIALGLMFAVLLAAVIRVVREPAAASMALVITALGSFFVAEHQFDVSGIMAVTFTALLGRHLLRNQGEEMMRATLGTMQWLGVLLNSVLFTLMGLVITWNMFTERWLAMLIALGAALLARYAAVRLSALACRFMGHPVPGGWQLVLSWGGIRGSVAIALVLALPEELPYWWTIQSMVFAVVLFGLLAQATSLRPLLGRLGLAKQAQDRVQAKG